MGAVLNLDVAMVTITCCHEQCGMTFAVPTWWESKRRESHSWWYCPNGHTQHFMGKTDSERLAEEKAALERRLTAEKANADWYMKRSREFERSRNVYKGKLTSMKNRTAHGCCPVPGCHRSFGKDGALQKHLSTKHPGFTAEVEEHHTANAPRRPRRSETVWRARQ